MDEKEFLAKLADILDVSRPITFMDDLENMEEWDSLSFVSFLAMADAYYEKKLTVDAVKQAKTIDDLYQLVQVWSVGAGDRKDAF